MRKSNNITFLLTLFCLITLTSTQALGQAPPSGIKEWTLLVFLNGNNNLDLFGKLNINQMEQVGSTENINVVVQWASLENKKTQRLYVTQDNDTRKVTSPIVQDMGQVDMGNWKSLVEFVEWGVANYPAKHYFLDIWDHGSGWHPIHATGGGSRGSFSPQDISWDEISGNHITTRQLGQALSEVSHAIGHKVDLFGSDACLMAMAEIADEVADSVEIFAASEELEPGAGWPYHTFLQRWSETPAASAATVSQILTDEYVKSYVGSGMNATLSAFDLNYMNSLNESLSNLGKAILKLDPGTKKQILKAANSSQVFAYSDYKDLADFLSVAEKANINGFGGEILKSTQKNVSQFIVAHGATPGYERALGVSIWLPTSTYTYKTHADSYHTLKFHSHTQWGDALQSLIQ